MADRPEKKPRGGDATESCSSSQKSDSDCSKLSWTQFFDNEKYRHQLMLVKTKQYTEV
ncbi:unnamed protein product, partial [Candidula unifasciata]